MKKILFYTQNRWAFGSLHSSLIKELYKHNIIGDILDWSNPYTLEEFKLLIDTYDYFVTTPDAIMHLYNIFKVPFEKIIAVAHEQWDLYLANKNSGVEYFNKIKDFSVISKILLNTCKDLNITRIPKITPAGINFENFYQPIIRKNLKYIGYGGSKQSYNFFGKDRKRGHLVEQVVKEFKELELINHNNYNFLCVPGYYKCIDCIIVSSLEEAGGMPAMEAAAAGKLVISTPLGYFEKHGPNGGGIVAPLDEVTFKEKVSKTLRFYIDNPREYILKCEAIQSYARYNYDWSVNIDSWIELLNN